MCVCAASTSKRSVSSFSLTLLYCLKPSRTTKKEMGMQSNRMGQNNKILVCNGDALVKIEQQQQQNEKRLAVPVCVSVYVCERSNKLIIPEKFWLDPSSLSLSLFHSDGAYLSGYKLAALASSVVSVCATVVIFYSHLQFVLNLFLCHLVIFFYCLHSLLLSLSSPRTYGNFYWN